MKDTDLREQLVRMLEWEEAHVGFDKAVDGVPAAKRGVLAAGFDHSLWQLVEHLRLAQDDILDFCVNASYRHTMKWPDDYWPGQAPPAAAAWDESVASFKQSREKMKELARTVPDLTDRVPTGNDRQTYLRAILLAADHAAYHVGQLIAVRRALGIWK
jgi:uncharacterized damage-inducible protein DinB